MNTKLKLFYNTFVTCDSDDSTVCTESCGPQARATIIYTIFSTLTTKIRENDWKVII